MKEKEAQALADKAMAAMMTALHLADIPLLDVSLPRGRSDEQKAAEARLYKDYLAEQGMMDRYSDSRDFQNDDAAKTMVQKSAPQETLYTFAQLKEAPETGDKNDRS